MKRLTLGMIIVSLAVLSGCTNVHFVRREGCTRNVFFIPWDVCENIDEPVKTSREEIRGDESINNAIASPEVNQE